MSAKRFHMVFKAVERKVFAWRLTNELHKKIFVQLKQEADFGYPFHTIDDLNRALENLDLSVVQKKIEIQLQLCPKPYRAAFRYIMRRDLLSKLSQYEAVLDGHAKTCRWM